MSLPAQVSAKTPMKLVRFNGRVVLPSVGIAPGRKQTCKMTKKRHERKEEEEEDLETQRKRERERERERVLTKTGRMRDAPSITKPLLFLTEGRHQQFGNKKLFEDLLLMQIPR